MGQNEICEISFHVSIAVFQQHRVGAQSGLGYGLGEVSSPFLCHGPNPKILPIPKAVISLGWGRGRATTDIGFTFHISSRYGPSESSFSLPVPCLSSRIKQGDRFSAVLQVHTFPCLTELGGAHSTQCSGLERCYLVEQWHCILFYYKLRQPLPLLSIPYLENPEKGQHELDLTW